MRMTQGMPPVKEKMRRTQAFFAGEEEAHLKKKLNAGAIPAPVLIRKKDGQVRGAWITGA